jgi:hypothetical protein
MAMILWEKLEVLVQLTKILDCRAEDSGSFLKTIPKNEKYIYIEM